MQPHDVHARLAEAPPVAALWGGGALDGPNASLARALEQHASEGCSICARALVNGREAAVDLALTEAPVRPSPRGRDALLSRARRVLEARRAARERRRDEGERRDGDKLLDPSAAVAHMHITLPSEAERIREIDALRAGEPRPGEGTARMLAQLARFLDFPLLFLSIVRGERVTYRAQHGLPEGLSAFRELRREMSYCTHCTSGDAPLLIENARVEPFFRGNKAVRRFGVTAYAGVPVRSGRGIPIGTLCALDFAPRAIPNAAVALLEVFARRATAEIERERDVSIAMGPREAPSPGALCTPEALADVLEATSERADVYARPFFRDLLSAERARAAPGRPSALLTVRAPEARQVLAWIDEEETAGRIDDATFGLLLPGAGPEAAERRLARLRSAAGAAVIAFVQG